MEQMVLSEARREGLHMWAGTRQKQLGRNGFLNRSIHIQVKASGGKLTQLEILQKPARALFLQTHIVHTASIKFLKQSNSKKETLF